MSHPREYGLTLIEVLVAVFVLGVGLIGTLALQGTAKSGNLESFQRTQAVLIARDIAERITSNRQANLESYEGTYTGSTVTSAPDCFGSAANSCSLAQMVNWDRYKFDQAILGASEMRGERTTGSLISAEGCIEHSNRLITIVIAWKGNPLGATASPPISDCGDNIVSTKRRFFTMTTFVGAPE